MKKILNVLVWGSLLGLSFPSKAEGPEDSSVVVRVPDDLKYKGQLKIEGEKGKGQGSEFYYRRCEVVKNDDATVEVKRSTCGEAKNAAIQKAVSLRPGYYLIAYSSSLYSDIVEIKANELTRIKLRKILVPAEKSEFRFNVFRDLTTLEEQKKFARFTWGSDSPVWALKFCKFHHELESEEKKNHEETNAEFRAYCIAAKTDDLDIYREKSFSFSSDGSYSTIQFKYWPETWKFAEMPHFENQGRLKVTDPKDGDFVSVFPGVYALEFRDSNDEISTDWGVTVEKEPGDLSVNAVEVSVDDVKIKKRK